MPSLRKLSWRPIIKLQAKPIVRAAYLGLLGRKPDRDVLAYYTKRLRADGGLVTLLRDLASSEEFRERYEASRADERAAALTYPNLIGVCDSPPDFPGSVWLTSRVCQQADFALDAYRYWIAAIRQKPTFHRKQWEFFFIAQALHERKMLVSGSRGLGFGVGQEPLPALFASLGCEIMATDQESGEAIRAGWAQTGQHASRIEPLNAHGSCDPESFSRLVRFEFADMNDIPARYRGRFDFCWSACCFEHLGSLEHGLTFVERSLDTLRPGGFAVHTTEFNLTSNDNTVESRDLSIYRRCDMERLAARLTRAGHHVEPIAYGSGNCPVDKFVDLPPYRHEPHLRLRIADFDCTSIGLIIMKSDCGNITTHNKQQATSQNNPRFQNAELFDISSIAHLARSRAESEIRARCTSVYLGDHEVLCRCLGKYKIFLDSRDVGFSPHIILDGYWEYWITRFMITKVQPGFCVLDIGANFGYYTLLLSDLISYSGRCVAFEPNPQVADKLRKSVAINGFEDRTQVNEVALGREPSGEACLYIPHGEPKNARVVPREYQFSTREDQLITVSRATFDSASKDIERLDFVKIDAEGAEADIVVGMEQTLRRLKPMLLLEFNASRDYNGRDLVEQLIGIYGSLLYLDFDAELKPVSIEDLLEKNVGQDWMLYFHPE